MSLIPNECVEFSDTRKVCVAEEGGKCYRLENTSRLKVRKVKIDGCLPQTEGERRCDYLINIDENDVKRAIFIELKGGQLTEGIKQVYETIMYLKSEFKNYRIDARIVGTRDVPGFINTPAYVKLDRVVKQCKGNIERRTNKILSETI